MVVKKPQSVYRSSGSDCAVGVPPTSNTGVLVTKSPKEDSLDKGKQQERVFSLGWLSFSCREDLGSSSGDEGLRFFLEYWAAVSGDCWQHFEDRGFVGYSRSYVSALGVRIGYSPGREDWYCSIPQSAINSVSMSDYLKMVRIVRESLSVKFCRVDLTIDDYSEQLSKDRLYDAYTKNNIASRSQERRWVESAKGFNRNGFCFYLGSRKSNTFLRIYDKGAESGGDNNATRLELELKHEQAETQLEYLLQIPLAEWGQAFMGILKAVVSFVDRSINTNVSRCPVLAWWSDFIAGVVAYRAPVPIQPLSIDRLLNWVSKSFGSTLGLLRKYFGDHYYLRLINSLEREDFNLRQRFLLGQKSRETWASA